MTNQQTFPEVMVDRLIDAERRAAAANSVHGEVAATASVINVNAETLLDVANALSRIVIDDEQRKLANRLVRGLDSIYFLSGRIHEMVWDTAPVEPVEVATPDSSSLASPIDENEQLLSEMSVPDLAGEEPSLTRIQEWRHVDMYLRNHFASLSFSERANILMCLCRTGSLAFDANCMPVIESSYPWIREVEFGMRADGPEMAEIIDAIIEYFVTEYDERRGTFATFSGLVSWLTARKYSSPYSQVIFRLDLNPAAVYYDPFDVERLVSSIGFDSYRRVTVELSERDIEIVKSVRRAKSA